MDGKRLGRKAGRRRREKNVKGQAVKSARAQVEELAEVLEKLRLGEYISYLNHPRRMLFINFLVGLLRGLGATIGATMVAGLLFLVLKRLVVLNLPVIGGLIAELVKLVNANNMAQ